ncbi:MAG: ABC transporter substrate-binding protein [Rhodobacterales bacterium]|nr:ABC transporter substrate-binding protein [Rhodobacterales bacterium]
MPNNPSRRSFVGSVVAGFALAGTASIFPNPALALTAPVAEALVEKIVLAINKVIVSGKPLSGMISDFEKIFVRYADVAIIARSTLGVDARSASASELRAFTKAFRGYISRKYGKRFKEFEGGRIEVRSTRKVKSFHEVKTMAFLKGQSPFDIKFLISDRSGKPLFFDMVIEGISLRLTERTEIGAMMDRRRGDISKVTADLKKAG